MTDPSLRDQEYIRRAFELAYFILSDKGIALRVVEDAWCSLDLILGDKKRNRRSYGPLLGFVKGEERSRPLRTKIRLSHEQMLQWLVYSQSDSWERATEYVDSVYLPGAEDMVVRYIKHLVRITSNRNSFYVTLGITRLLYEYGTQEVRLMYDVLTASDSARMKDMDYFRKQKARLMDEVLLRFDGTLRTVRSARRERRFESQPTTERLIRLVSECMRRFTPWGTICTVQEGFDPTSVSGLYFAGTNLAEEDQIEMTRIHAIMHPDCFSRLVSGLSRFVEELPSDSQDKSCKYGPSEEFLAVPQFYGFTNKDRRDDRFDPPKLEPEDYLRLERSREALARRRKAHLPHRLYICVDDVERAWFDPSRTTRVQLDIDPGESVIEVRGEDSQGALPVAILIACCDDIPSGGAFRDSIMLEAGQKVTIQLRPIRNQSGDVEKASVEVSYAETRLIRAVSWYAKRAWLGFVEITRHQKGPHVVGQDNSWLVMAGIILALIVAAVTLIWFQLRTPNNEVPSQLSGGPPPLPTIQPAPSTPAPVAPTLPVQKQAFSLIARATWSSNPEAARQAIRLDTERGEIREIEIPHLQRSLLIALPQTDTESIAYTHYRATLLAADKPIWQQTLQAPRGSQSKPAHVLNVLLSSQPRLKAEPLLLRFDGKTRRGWQPLGEVTLQLVSR